MHTQTSQTRIQSLKIAKVRKMQQALSQDLIWITFFRLIGEIITKRGTRNARFIPKQHVPIVEASPSERLITFYSYNEGWVSFEPERLISFSVA